MKKSDQSQTIFDNDLSTHVDFAEKRTKTTDINILLNRVKLDKKKDLKKRLIFLILLVSIIGIISFLALV